MVKNKMKIGLSDSQGQAELAVVLLVVTILALGTVAINHSSKSRIQKEQSIQDAFEGFYAQEVAALNVYHQAVALNDRTPATTTLSTVNKIDSQGLPTTIFNAAGYTSGTAVPLGVTKQFDPGAGVIRRYTATNLTRQISSSGGSVRFCGSYGVGKNASTTCIAEAGFDCSVVQPSGFAGGTGTVADPYLICNLTQLNLVRSKLQKAYALMADITFPTPNGFAPIGSQFGPFSGSFDGRDHTLANFTYSASAPNDSYIGLFANINTTGTVKNIKMTNVNVSGRFLVGALSGGFDGGGTLSNIQTSGTVSATGGTAGGVVGIVYWAVASNLSSSVNASAPSSPGGVFGALLGGSLTNSFATGTITGGVPPGGGTASAGGLVGLISVYFGKPNPSVTNSYATGNVSGSDNVGGLFGLCGSAAGTFSNLYSTGNVTGRSATGGLIGLNQCALSQVHSTGNVIGVSNGALWPYHFGGLIGVHTTNTIARSYSTGSVTAPPVPGVMYVGGFIGQLQGVVSITDSYSTGNVTGPTTYACPTAGFIASGLANQTTANCYSTGTVTAQAGSKHGFSYILAANSTNSFWDTQTSGLTTSQAGIGKTTAQMKTAATFINAGWNPAIWNLVDGGYPTLK